MTKEQEKWLKDHSHRGIQLDDTHNVTRYGLKLTTLLVVDKYEKGLPAGTTFKFSFSTNLIAFLLSKSTTSEDVSVLFEVVKNVFPDFQPTHLMSDEAYVFYNGYLKVQNEK